MERTQMKTFDGRKAINDSHGCETTKDFLTLFRANRVYIEQISEDTHSFLSGNYSEMFTREFMLSAMAKFILKKVDGVCKKCRCWTETDDGVTGQYKCMPAEGICHKKTTKIFETESCDDYEETK